MRLRAAAVGMVFVLAASVALAACGGDDDDSSGSGSGSETTAQAPEDLRASDAEVAAGLATIKTTATQIAAAVEAGSKNTAQDPRRQDRAGVAPDRRHRQGERPGHLHHVRRQLRGDEQRGEEHGRGQGQAGRRHDQCHRRRVSGEAPRVTAYARRGALLLLGALLVLGLWSTSAQAATASRPVQNGAVSKAEAIRQLDVVRGVDRPHARAEQGRPVGEGLRRSEGGIPQSLRVRRDPAARRRPAADLRRRDEVRRDPRPDQLGCVRRGDPFEHRRPPRSHRRRRTPAHRYRYRRARGRLRPVLPHHLPRRPRSGPPRLGAARLPRSRQGDAVPAPDRVGHGRRGAGDACSRSSSCAPFSTRFPSAGRCSRRSPPSSRSRSSSTCRSG